MSVRRKFSGRRVLAGSALGVALAAGAVAVADPFAGHAAPRDSNLDNGSPTSTSRVERTSLASQTQVSGTLGFSGSWTVAVPAGTAQSSVLQAEQQQASAQAAVTAAEAIAGADEQALAEARSALHAARLKESSDCAGANAAASGDSGSSQGSGSSPCASAMQTVSADETAESAAQQKVTGDRAQLASARATLSGAQQTLDAARATAMSYGSSSSYTMLPSPGHVVRRGQPLYAIDGQATLLLYGSMPAWRAFRAGMSAGADVAELNANLAALGYGARGDDVFTSQTSSAIAALQQAHGLPQTGTLDLGAVVFEPGPLRVTTVTPTVGQAVQAGLLLAGTSTREEVVVQLDAAQQSEVRVGDRVGVILPDNSSTPGVVSAVGRVATVSSADQQAAGGSSSPTINVTVRLLRPSAAGHLDKAPVEVSITEQSARNVLAVPVNALVALAGGGYAVEELEPDGTHQLVAVRPGLFDDARGLVEVSGSGLAAGQRVVIPAP